MRIFSILIILISVFLSFSCISTKNLAQRTKDSLSYCGPTHCFDYSTQDDFLSRGVIFSDSVLLKNYSHKDLLLANAAGVYPLLKKLELLKNDRSRNELEYVSLKQQIQIKLSLFSTQISSVVAELDCEGERSSQMAYYISDIEEKKTRLRTIKSIIIGSISSIITTVSQDRSLNNAVAISGGALTAGLGILALFTNKKTEFKHPRNMLSDIWYSQNVDFHFPPSVWYILNERVFSNAQEHPVAYNIKERWIQYGYVNKKSEETLFFGKGGKYSGDQLKIRANMLNQLQSIVREINQNLEVLIAKFSTK